MEAFFDTEHTGKEQEQEQPGEESAAAHSEQVENIKDDVENKIKKPKWEDFL